MICSRKSASLVLAVAAMVFSVTVTSKAENKRQLVTSKIDDAVTVRLFGNTRPEVNARNDRGAVDKEMPMENLKLLLKRPAELDVQLTKYLDDIQDPKSAVYHKRMSAEEFGEKFGPSDADVETVKRWLESQGFTINVTYANKMFIDFSGSARQVETAFHTEIRNYEVNGEMHIANSHDPAIPAALADAVHGVLSLNDFHPKAMHENIHQGHLDARTGEPRTEYNHAGSGKGGVTPNYTTDEGELEIVPYDLEKIYNIAPLFATGISGQGMKIVVVEDTNLFNCNASNTAGNTPGTICSATSDWATFRNAFGLGRYTTGALYQENPAPQAGANNCTATKTSKKYPTGVNSDDIEAAIDVEWATAAAPSATIVNAACGDPRGGFGGLTAIQNILSHPNADNVDVISMSYGESEEETGQTLNAAFNTTFQQAAAQLIPVFVSSGDEDAASTGPGYGITISGWESSPYDVSVGGLDFADSYLGTNADFWLPNNNVFYGSAKSYIPEQPWNDSCASGTIASAYGYATTYGSTGFCNSSIGTADYLNATGGSGGPSACATGTPSVGGVASGTCAGWPKPAYQTNNLGAMAGLVNDGVRDTPDVALMAANGVWGHYYAVCYSNTVDTSDGGTPCTGAPSNWPGFGGTSVSSPIFAGIQALVVQHKGSLQGLPNARYYQLAAKEYGPAGSATCNSTNGPTGSSACIFHDVTLGDNDSVCVEYTAGVVYQCYFGDETPGLAYGVLSTSNNAFLSAYPTTTGWDFASGIGSVNAYNLVINY